MKALEGAKPNWQTDGLGLRGNPEDSFKQQTKIEWPDADIVPTLRSSPVTTPDVFIPTTIPISSGTGEFPFRLIGQLDDTGDPQVVIRDGTINGELPTGMGTNNYTIDLVQDVTVCAVVTIDLPTLTETSRTLAVYPITTAPASSVTGDVLTLIFEIGDAEIQFTGPDISGVKTDNFITTNIVYTPTYGDLNGTKSVFPVHTWGIGGVALP